MVLAGVRGGRVLEWRGGSVRGYFGDNERVWLERHMASIYHVSVVPGIDFDCLVSDGGEYEDGCEVVVQCQDYQDFAVVEGLKERDVDEAAAQKEYQAASKGRTVQGKEFPRIVRRADQQDKSRAHEKAAMAASMFKTAQRKVSEHGLDMKMLNAHVALDGKLVIFQFVSEGRVDFRHLLRDLSGALHMRVELRQVGVRDEAAIQGGLGPCGRAFCCATFLDRFHTINVRMAKNQGLSLNPTNISGACGRLKCCLRYEDKFYAEAKRQLPRSGSRARTAEGEEGKIIDVNVLTGMVRVRLDSGNHEILTVPADSVTVVAAPQRRKDSGGERNRKKGADKGGKRGGDEDSREGKKGDGGNGSRGSERSG